MDAVLAADLLGPIAARVPIGTAAAGFLLESGIGCEELTDLLCQQLVATVMRGGAVCPRTMKKRLKDEATFSGQLSRTSRNTCQTRLVDSLGGSLSKLTASSIVSSDRAHCMGPDEISIRHDTHLFTCRHSVVTYTFNDTWNTRIICSTARSSRSGDKCNKQTHLNVPSTCSGRKNAHRPCQSRVHVLRSVHPLDGWIFQGEPVGGRRAQSRGL